MNPKFESERPTNRKILLVDREHELQGPLIVKLKRAGFDTITARRGIDAIRIAKEESLVLVIIDPRIQDMSGAKLGARLRENASTCFLFLTGSSTKKYAAAAMEAGALTILSKTSHPDDLVSQIQLAIKQAIEVASTQRLNERLHRKVNDSGSQERLIGSLMEKWDLDEKAAKRILLQFARNHRLSIEDLAQAHASHRDSLSRLKKEYSQRMVEAQPPVLVELSLFLSRSQQGWHSASEMQKGSAQ